jgi:hypothetical protein
MGETSSQNPRATDMTPGIAASKLKKVFRDGIVRDSDSYEVKPSEEFIVRVRANQASVSFTLNTKRMVERREIERANERKRRSDR